MIELHFSLAVQHLPTEPSDHALLLISAKTRIDDKPRSFRFLNFWTTHPDFLHVVRTGWLNEHPGNPLQRLRAKLRHLKTHLQQWSKACFGNIFHKLKVAEQGLILAQQQFDNGNADETREQLFKTKAELRYLLNLEEPL